MSQITIVEAFAQLEDCRRRAGMRHQQSLCLALFTLAVAAGNRGFIAIGDWLKAYHDELLELFNPEKTAYPPTVRSDERYYELINNATQPVYPLFLGLTQ
jgi:hypothetical protein